MNWYARIVVLTASILLAIPAHAQNDPRMSIDVGKGRQGEMPSVKDAVQQALPLLWDRVLPVKARSSVSDNINATSFLQRVVPSADSVQVIFNEERVWNYLDQQQIVYLKDAPHLNLQIQMYNQNDVAMSQTVSALQRYAEGVAAARGIVLDPAAVQVSATWRWMDASQIVLMVRIGNDAEPVSDTRQLSGGDPLVLLQKWLEELMLGLRDSSFAGGNEPVIEQANPQAPVGYNVLLTIESPASLPEQIVLEEALRQSSRVRSLTPVYLSASSRQYRLVLKEGDSGWIEGWFRKRGMQARPSTEGWIVR